jgi:hypothetical protein
MIGYETLAKAFKAYNFTPKGVLHIGAHTCEEMGLYTSLGTQNVVWIDAIQESVDACKQDGFKNVYQALITDKDDETKTFHISNNGRGASSSIFEFGTHAYHYTDIKYISQRDLKTTTIDTFFQRHNLDPSQYDMWNFDIQGAELLALKGGLKSLIYPRALYLEVNTEYVYKDCNLIGEIEAFLQPYGFKRVVTLMTGSGWGDALWMR